MDPQHSSLDAPEPRHWARDTEASTEPHGEPHGNLLDEIEELREQVEALRTEVQRSALLSSNTEELVHHLREWLSWDDWDRQDMSVESKAFVSRSLRGSVDEILRRMPHG